MCRLFVPYNIITHKCNKELKFKRTPSTSHIHGITEDCCLLDPLLTLFSETSEICPFSKNKYPIEGHDSPDSLVPPLISLLKPQ